MNAILRKTLLIFRLRNEDLGEGLLKEEVRLEGILPLPEPAPMVLVGISVPVRARSEASG